MNRIETGIYRMFVVIVVLLSAPVIFGISLSILCTMASPIFFLQKRVGKGGVPFTMYKFRTMRVGAEKEQSKLLKRNEAAGPVFKIRNDPRFTRIGKFLSHTGLDELPQLVNVLKGEMALIGPRPLPLSEAAKLKSWMRERETILPGIISPWIFDGYHTQKFDDWMKSDIAYVHAKSLVTDCILVVKAMRLLFRLVLNECGA